MIRPTAYTHDPISSWANVLQRNINSHNVIGGNGVSVDRGSSYTKISVANEADAERLQYRGEYDIDAEYFVNDVVFVNPNKTYYDSGSASNIELDSSDVAGYDKCPLAPGTYVAVQYVPPSFANEEYLSSRIVPQYAGGVLPYDIQTGIRLESYNIYYPVYPTIPSSYTSSVATTYGFSTKTNQTYWMPLAPMIRLNSCVNGTNSTTYIVGVVSGSSFNADYLPYSTE